MKQIEVLRREGASNFKVTITTDGDLRIKSFVGADTNEERKFIDRCKLIQEYFTKNPYPTTLRGKITSSDSNIHLLNSEKLTIFKLVDNTLIKKDRDEKISNN